ncbi:methyltransferase domain-containing protein [Azospirillum sp. sgz301742]
MMRAALSEVERLRGRSVLEVGCGSGAFAHMLFDRTDMAYRGFDFSPSGVQAAQRRVRGAKGRAGMRRTGVGFELIETHVPGCEPPREAFSFRPVARRP